MTFWIDTHCHLDATEFRDDLAAVSVQARSAKVVHCVIPAVAVNNFQIVRELAHQYSYSYALGIHPMCVPDAQDADLQALDAELTLRKSDPRLVAVGEIGLDYFVPELMQSPMRERQEHFYREQLKIARKHGLPVILHVRRSADKLLKHLREISPVGGWSGIAHAFNGSEQQAGQFQTRLLVGKQIDAQQLSVPFNHGRPGIDRDRAGREQIPRRLVEDHI